jgi:hypothetical protein
MVFKFKIPKMLSAWKSKQQAAKISAPNISTFSFFESLINKSNNLQIQYVEEHILHLVSGGEKLKSKGTKSGYKL